MNKSIFLSNIHYAYGRTDGTYAWPNSLEGDMLKQAMKELENARYENNLLVQKCRELQEQIDALKHEVERNMDGW